MRLPKLPNKPIPFVKHRCGSGDFVPPKDHHWCRVIAFRPPKKGEYYLSGAIVTAWKAPNDLSTSYWIVEPVEVKPAEVLHEYPTNI